MNIVVPTGRARVALSSFARARTVRFLGAGLLLLLALACGGSALRAAPQLLPGVYGYGMDRANNPAGFASNAEVYAVTLLTDNGNNASAPAGTLRAALYKRNKDANNVLIPRIVVFHVSGEITLKANLTVYEGNITVAGQTAPTGGISIRGASLVVLPSNVLMQHLRIRPGDEWLPNPITKNRDALNVGTSVATTNVVFDHCTFAWSLDEMISLWTNWDSVTFHRCLFAEPLRHSIHLDEDQLAGDAPVQGESLTPTLTNMTTSTEQRTGVAVSDWHRLLSTSTNNGAADFVINMLAEPDNKDRTDLHVVVAGITGPNRGPFRVEVRRTSNLNETPIQSGNFDQYAPSGQEKLTSYVLAQGTTGFLCSGAAQSLYIRILSTSPNGTARELSVDLLSLGQGHAMGPLFGNGGTGLGRVSMTGSVVAHLMERGPWIGSRDTLVANNVFYNRRNKFVMMGSVNWNTLVRASVVGNTFIEGASQGTGPVEPIYFQRLPTAGMQFHEADNHYDRGGSGNVNMVDPDLAAYTGADTTDSGNGRAGFLPLPHRQAYEAAMFFAGARPNDRDAFEGRIFTEITAGFANPVQSTRAGRVRHSVADAGGWPAVVSGNNNGVWNPAIPSLATQNTMTASGYTNIELWLHQIAAQVEGGLTPDGSYQSEGALLGGSCTLQSNNLGFHGKGFVDFPPAPSTNGTLTFNNVAGGSGGAKILRIRYALAAAARTGHLVVNGGTPQSITFPTTTQWTTWATLDVPVTLASGNGNSIQLKTTGNDLANIDEITIVGAATFHNFDGGSTTGWTTFGGTWSASAGSPFLRQSDNAATAPFAMLAPNGDDQSITADARLMSFGTNGWFGLVTRYTDTANYYYVKITATTAEIKKVVGGVPSTIGTSVAFTPLTNAWQTVRFQAIGSQLKLFVDGIERRSVTDSTFSVGKAGIVMYRAAVDYDNVHADPTPAGAQLAFEDFQDSVANGYTTSGGTWTFPTDGTIVYKQGNTGDTTTSRATFGSGWADQVVSARAKPLTFGPTPGRWFGIVGRYVDANNYYYLKVANGGAIELRKLVGGAQTTLHAGTYAFSTGTWYTLKLESIGNSHRAYINDQLVLRANDNAFTAGGAGVMTHGATAHFDDVRVTAP